MPILSFSDNSVSLYYFLNKTCSILVWDAVSPLRSMFPLFLVISITYVMNSGLAMAGQEACDQVLPLEYAEREFLASFTLVLRIGMQFSQHPSMLLVTEQKLIFSQA